MIRRIASALCKSAVAANEKFCPGWVGGGRFAAARAQSRFLIHFGLKANNISSKQVFLYGRTPVY